MRSYVARLVQLTNTASASRASTSRTSCAVVSDGTFQMSPRRPRWALVGFGQEVLQRAAASTPYGVATAIRSTPGATYASSSAPDVVNASAAPVSRMPLVSPKLKLDFLRRQVLMSRNISGGPLMSIFMGGLNYQIEHHLFPTMARPYLRKAQPLVAAYCAAQGVAYTRTTLWQSYRIVIGYLNTVGLRGKDPFLCPLVAQRRAL
jgi:Fatty acid desaturase